MSPLPGSCWPPQPTAATTAATAPGDKAQRRLPCTPAAVGAALGRPNPPVSSKSEEEGEMEAKARGRWRQRPEGRRCGRRVTWEGVGQVDFK